MKICPYRFNPDIECNYNLFMKSKAPAGYLAPEQLEPLKLKQADVQFNYHKVDVFCLGMLMLEACSLEPSQLCYDWLNMEISNECMMSRLNAIMAHYSKSVLLLINSMLDQNPSTRPSMSELYEKLKPFESKIRSGEKIPDLFPKCSFSPTRTLAAQTRVCTLPTLPTLQVTQPSSEFGTSQIPDTQMNV